MVAGEQVSRELRDSVERKAAGFPNVLHSLAAVVLFPFDDVLGGMVAAGQGIQAICNFLQLTRFQLDDHLARLGLATPHNRPMRKVGRNPWSVWDVIRLIFWRSSGVHPEVIGKKLNRSAGAVRAKWRRLGQKAPPRKLLHKPDPAILRDPEPGVGWQKTDSAIHGPLLSTCGRIAGLVTWRSLEDAKGSLPLGDATGVEPANTFEGAVRQPEFALLGLVGGTDHQSSKPGSLKNGRQIAKLVREPVKLVLPKTEAEVDFNADLTWIGKIRRPLTNKVAVWVCGMLLIGGLHYTEAAKRAGMTAAAFRTFRTRSAIPVDDDRRKFGKLFDEQIARETLAYSGYKLRECASASENKDGRGNWFWVGRNDRFTRFSPPKRKRDHDIEGRFNRIKILKGGDAQPMRNQIVPPFAKTVARTGCNGNSWSAARA
jgi:hypothetical protein